MTRVQVVSSALHELGYCADSRLLEVTFTNGSLYRYYDVPPGLVQKLLDAPSIGRFFNAFIASSFGYAPAESSQVSVAARPELKPIVAVSGISVDALKPLIPEPAFDYVADLVRNHNISVTVTPPKRKAHGDYRNLNGIHTIRMNENPNLYRFLITLIHEIAHALAWEQFRHSIQPHGREWKAIYRSTLSPLTGRGIFPPALDRLVIAHCNRPKYTTDIDRGLIAALRPYDQQSQHATGA
jgi:SprT protein